MHNGVITCVQETPLFEVAKTMADLRLHCVVVTDDHDCLAWGVVSDLDLVAAASIRALDDQTVGTATAAPIVTVSPDDTLERAARLMTTHATAHLVVTNPQTTRPLGVLSTLDIATALARA